MCTPNRLLDKCGFQRRALKLRNERLKGCWLFIWFKKLPSFWNLICVNSQISLFWGNDHVLLFFSLFCFLQVHIWITKYHFFKLCSAFFCFLLFDPTWSIFMKPSDSKTFFSPPEGQAIWKRDLWFRAWILWTLILQSYEMKTEAIKVSIGLSPHTEGVCPFWLQTETNYTECRIMYRYCPFSEYLKSIGMQWTPPCLHLREYLVTWQQL